VTKTDNLGLLKFCAVYEAQNADNARTLRIRFDEKLREFFTKRTALSEENISVCN